MRHLALAVLVLALVAAVSSAALFLRPQSSDGAERAGVIYLSADPRITDVQIERFGVLVVPGLEALDAEFREGVTWAVIFDPEYLEVLDDGRLGQWYLDGIVLLGMEVDVPTLISAARATPDEGLADMQPPSEIQALLDPTPTSQAGFAVITDGYASKIFRTSEDVLAAGGCALSGAGYIELRERTFEYILGRTRGVGQGMIQTRDGTLVQSCR